MDLIYADENKRDIGVLSAYELDMAYGADENDFSCTIDRSDHCCREHFYIYVEGEEYGGVIDHISVVTGDEDIKYTGRTWHGILENKVIKPDAGNDHLLLAGEANAVLQEIIDRIGLSDMFEASEEDTEVEIVSYQMPRYCYAYTGIRNMLKEFGMKLKLKWQDGKVILSAEPIHDYSQDEEFDTSQVDFKITKKFRTINHIICMGQGDLKERAVIHIFTDENGGIQPYLKPGVTEPMQDSDYILDESQKAMTGIDEIEEVYDVPSADITTNYIPLSAKPGDWETNCESYFYYEPQIEIIDNEEVDVGGSYREAAMVDVKYILQKKQPYDWAENFSSYFFYDQQAEKFKNVQGSVTYSLLTSKPGNWNEDYEEYYVLQSGTYKKVTGVTNVKYVKQTKQPSDWGKNYGEYYIRYNDGTQVTYQNVNGITYYTYDLQTSKPSDWNANYGSYYRRATAKELKKNKKKQWYAVEKTKAKKVPAWKAKKYYTRHSHEKAPKWSGATRYTKKETVTPPTWTANKYYIRNDNSAPTWAAKTYYSSTDLKVAPPWVNGKYFLQVFDRYAVMVSEAIEKLKEYYASDEMNIDLEETGMTYDVGDIVGTTEQVTGIEATQEVVKKIVTIKNDDVVISYEVG